jgi:hypothetical protein
MFVLDMAKYPQRKYITHLLAWHSLLQNPLILFCMKHGWNVTDAARNVRGSNEGLNPPV